MSSKQWRCKIEAVFYHVRARVCVCMAAGRRLAASARSKRGRPTVSGTGRRTAVCCRPASRSDCVNTLSGCTSRTVLTGSSSSACSSSVAVNCSSRRPPPCLTQQLYRFSVVISWTSTVHSERGDLLVGPPGTCHFVF